MAIQLSPDQENRIAEALQSGHYQSPAEVIDHALDLLREHEDWFVANREGINAKIEVGLAQLARGEGISESDFKERLRQRRSQRE